jgi:hypothetical protein
MSNTQPNEAATDQNNVATFGCFAESGTMTSDARSQRLAAHTAPNDFRTMNRVSESRALP